ncbi:MAG: hypothetical protein ACBZ72_00590 [Candidatus Bathyarchaeia archaeon]|jgi:hypothetical protein
MDTFLIFPIIFLLFVGFIFIVTTIATVSKNRSTKKSQYQSKEGVHYNPAGFSPQMELDIRLPYRRFKQIYPHSNISYEQYKQLQKQRAFKRSRSNQENSRMVR